MSGHMAPTLDAAPLKSINRPEKVATIAHGGQKRRHVSRFVSMPHHSIMPPNVRQVHNHRMEGPGRKAQAPDCETLEVEGTISS